MTDTTLTTGLNTVTWWEIPVKDLDKAQAFYGAVFGWTFQPFGEGYVGISAAGVMIGGLSTAGPENSGEGVRVYVNVADMEAVLETIEGHGGAVTTPRQEVGGDMGWWATFTDDQGRAIGLCTMTPAT